MHMYIYIFVFIHIIQYNDIYTYTIYVSDIFLQHYLMYNIYIGKSWISQSKKKMEISCIKMAISAHLQVMDILLELHTVLGGSGRKGNFARPKRASFKSLGVAGSNCFGFAIAILEMPPWDNE